MTTAAPPLCPRVAELAGWYGMSAILAAYALLNFEALQPSDRCYLALNLTGALGVAWVCFYKRTWQAFWLEAAWAMIAIVAIVRRWLQ